MNFPKARHHYQRGSVTIELALLLPLFMVLLMAIGDFGRLVHHKLVVTSAVNAGVRYGSLNMTNFVDDAGIINAVEQGGIDLPIATANITLSPRQCFCITNNGQTLVLMADCVGTCSGLDVDPSPAKFLSVSVSQPFTPLFTWPISIGPITATASARAQ